MKENAAKALFRKLNSLIKPARKVKFEGEQDLAHLPIRQAERIAAGRAQAAEEKSRLASGTRDAVRRRKGGFILQPIIRIETSSLVNDGAEGSQV